MAELSKLAPDDRAQEAHEAENRGVMIAGASVASAFYNKSFVKSSVVNEILEVMGLSD